MDEPREQEQSIKDRKRLLYEADEWPTQRQAEGKPFAEHLRETPADPVPTGIKAALWAAGIVAGLLLAAAGWKLSQPREKAQTPAKKSVKVQPPMATQSASEPALG